MDISCLASSFGLQPVSTTKACRDVFWSSTSMLFFVFCVFEQEFTGFAVSLGVCAMCGQFQ